MDGEQVSLDQGARFEVQEDSARYTYLQHQVAGEQSRLAFYALDTMSVDHALSYLLRGYRGLLK